MKLRSLLRAPCHLLAAWVLLFPLSASSQTKTIRLRNESIATLPGTNAAPMAQAQLAQPPASGLFLVQFEGQVEPAWRAELRSRGVELLKYVPDDAFIARFNGASPDKLRALSFVRWVGPYRPDYKVHPRLAAAARQALQGNQAVAVNVLLAPGTAPAEITQVRSLLWSVVQESRLRQGTILRGQLPPGALEALAQSPAVLWVERAPRRKLVDELASKLVGGDDGQTGTPTLSQQLGFGGSGVTVCVADTGLDTGNTNTMHPDVRGRVSGLLAYPPLTDGADGCGHGTHVAGIVAGNAATGETDPDTGAWYGLGVAASASLFIERIFDDDANEVSPPPSDADLTTAAVRNGAQIGSNSWGNDVQGEYDTDAAQFDELVRDADPATPGDQPYVLSFAAGNAGPGSQSLDSPATGKNVIATGGCENFPGTLAMTFGLYADGPDTMADFSSRGPCEDGRIKPDLVAPGTWIASLASSAAPNEAAIAWWPIDNYYVYMGGTSMSGPFAAGAAAVFVQYYKALHANALPSPALVKAALINSAQALDEANGGPGPIPNHDEGWGRITLTNIIFTNINSAPRCFEYIDQTVLLTNGQVYLHHTLVQGSDQPLKLTLAYTDVPGFPGAIPALVNDLDLEVVAPDGTLYRGNQFSAGESVPNPPSPDNLNNVEAVHLAQPLPGDYLVRVRARKVVEDARLDTASIDQDFALVISGNLARPGSGMILLDRASYTAPSLIQLQVLDAARAASNSLSVLLKSTTEPAGETILLHPSGADGSFTGAVATVVGNAAADGKLELHNGDTIEADYLDSSGNMRVATATAELVPPSLSGLAVAVDLGIITITWQTSEPANSIVRYSTNHAFNLAATNNIPTTTHTVRLSGLLAGQTYYFFVTSADVAGNTATNDNSGAFFTFLGVATPTVLLIDAYDSAAEADNGSTVIDDGAYTNALAATGFSFGFWKVLERGSPQLSDLQPFPVVVWRTTDDIVNYDGTNNTLTAQQQSMLQTYLNGGGSFFMASMGILSQLGDVPFRRNVLQVAGFKPNPDPPAPCDDCDEDYGVPAVLGAPGDPITGGMSLVLDYSSYPSFDDGFGDVYGPDFSDTFTPATNATPIFFESVSGKPCGMSYPPIGQDSPGRVVFLSFPLDTVPATGPSPNNEVALLRNLLSFLAPGANGLGQVFLDNSTYTTPDQVTVEVADSDLAGAGQAQATFSTSSATNRLTVVLNETTHPGLFRGYIVLVAAITTGATNQLAVRNGDTITAAYFDASNNRSVLTTATVDTLPPAISQVAALTHYGDALVSWTTSKPADSLVQYGQSTLPDRTAYSADLVTNHTVSVTGLSANRNYYYQVVSRDAAGNTTVDDNQGALYTFTTLRAPRPPWSDDLESGAPGWTVVPDPIMGTDLNWTLGTPNNGLQTQAHSGTNAWGSNLDGQPFNFLASSLLLSPIIDLSGFSQATLNFWDCFDFSSGLEQGQLLISTNSASSGAALEALPTFADFSGLYAPDWQRETLDLTPYVGRTIQVVWWYVGISIGDPTYGWLVDDVAVTGLAFGQGGTIVVSKNLGQGTFTLTGPASQSGSDILTTISNAPPGQYSVHFSDVPFYQTPAPQTNTLDTADTLTFTGNYTFVDANRNGMSDAWEKYYFGEVSTKRTQHTDTDGDGMSDYAEFIAGTNPTNAASKLIFLAATLQTNDLVQFQWAAIPGRIYQVQTSTHFTAWTPLSPWLQASGSPMSYTATNSGNRAQFYRVQVRP
ncbi:MAG: S8 family serine peptidase [Verrucomicrobiota bacterium]